MELNMVRYIVMSSDRKKILTLSGFKEKNGYWNIRTFADRSKAKDFIKSKYPLDINKDICILETKITYEVLE